MNDSDGSGESGETDDDQPQRGKYDAAGRSPERSNPAASRVGSLNASLSELSDASLGAIRIVWAAVAAVVLVITWLAMSPSAEIGTEVDWRSEVESAESMSDLNNDSAEGAPQQQVVNGWLTNDLMAIQAGELEDTHAAAVRGVEVLSRVGAMILIIGLALIGDVALRAWSQLRLAQGRGEYSTLITSQSPRRVD